MNGPALLDHVLDLAPLDDIVSAAQAGSDAAFAALHSIYSRRLYRTILSITRNPQDAEEALQETYLRAYLAINKFERKSAIYSWLTRIAVNSALMVLRKQRARPELLFDPQQDDRCERSFFEPKDPDPNPEEAYCLHQRQITTLRSVRRLDPALRAPIWMQLKYGWSIRQIGRALNISDAAVKSRLYRARQRLLSTSIVA